MKKFLTTLAAVLLSLCLCFGFAACGENNAGGDDNGGSGGNGGDVTDGGESGGKDDTGDDPQDEKTVYTVTFDSQGGSEVPAQRVLDGEYATQPDEPKTEGKVFLYWSDKVGGERFLFSAHKITGNITLYAVWSEYHTVTFDSQGGSHIDAQQVADGGYARQPDRPEKVGSYFLHWSEEIDGKRFVFTSRIITKDITLYAVWGEAYTVTFDTQGGSDIPAQYVSPNTSARNPDSPTRSGYHFLGWYTQAEGGDEWKWNDPVTGNITVYAHWESDDETEATASLEYTYDTNLGGYVVSGVGQETDIRIPNEYNGTRGLHPVVGIGDRAFRYKHIASVELPASLVSIGANAFTRTDLVSVTIPASVTTLESFAFSECKSLTSVTFEAGSRLGSIGQRAFADDSALLELTIPANVTSIGSRLIYNSGVTTIRFLGTRSAWDAINKADNWDYGKTDVAVICSDDNA